MTPFAPFLRGRLAVRPAPARGIIFAPLLVGLMFAAVLAGVLGYTYISVAKSNAVSQLKTQTGNILQQAAYTLSTEAADSDNDGMPESTAGLVANTGTDTGWNVPSTSGAPKADAWGTALRYCAWDNGSTNSSTGRLNGDTPASQTNLQASVVFALISAGPDKTFSTTCAQAKAGTPQGDDLLRTMTVSQVVQGVGGTAYLGDPVTNTTALEALPTSAVKKGQIRVAGTTTYVNLTGVGGTIAAGNWAVVGGSGSGVNVQGSFASIGALTPVTVGELAVATDTGGLFVNTAGLVGSSAWQLVLARGASLNGITVSGGSTVSVTTNVALSATTVATASGGTPNYSYTTSPALPAGLAWSFTPSTGTLTISGTTTAAITTTTYTVTMYDVVGGHASTTFILTNIPTGWTYYAGWIWYPIQVPGSTMAPGDVNGYLNCPSPGRSGIQDDISLTPDSADTLFTIWENGLGGGAHTTSLPGLISAGISSSVPSVSALWASINSANRLVIYPQSRALCLSNNFIMVYGASTINSISTENPECHSFFSSDAYTQVPYYHLCALSWP